MSKYLRKVTEREVQMYYEPNIYLNSRNIIILYTYDNIKHCILINGSDNIVKIPFPDPVFCYARVNNREISTYQYRSLLISPEKLHNLYNACPKLLIDLLITKYDINVNS